MPMAAVLASEGPTVLHGVPELVDVSTLAQLLASLGVDVGRVGQRGSALVENGEPSGGDAGPTLAGGYKRYKPARN